MHWLLAALALFNVVSMIAIYRDRHARRVAVPWTLFAYSLITSELAWLWLPTQVVLALLLIAAGALSSAIGVAALLVLVVSWMALVKSISLAFRAAELTESALKQELGENYCESLAPEVRRKLETKATFSDWRRPFHMRREGVEKLTNICYGPLGIKHQLDIYRPTEIPEQGCPVVLQIHGGAWMIGSKEHQALPLMHLLASKGWICVAINYRLSPSVSFPTHLEDCKRALCWIRTEGHSYGMNPGFVAVTGGSAGGHLSALMGLTGNYPELQKDYPQVDTCVQAVVPFYGAYDFLARFDDTNRELFTRFIHRRIIYESPEEKPELWDLASPITHIRPDLPPFMIVQGEIDSLTTIKGARSFQQKLRETSNSAVIYIELPGAEHAFDNIHSPRTDPVIKGVHRFLEWARAHS